MNGKSSDSLFHATIDLGTRGEREVLEAAEGV